MGKRAFIFDLDGVLTDTARLHYEAWKELSDVLGLKFNIEDNERLKGVSRRKSFDIILEINRKSYSEEEVERYLEQKNRRYVSLLDTITPNDILPGILEFLNNAREAGILLAVVSASRNADYVLERLEIKEKFDYIADANLISKPKPDPEIFTVCAEALGVAPLNCVGFEDAEAGIIAIQKANIFAVGIGVQSDTVKPDLALESTSDLDINMILEVIISIEEKAAALAEKLHKGQTRDEGTPYFSHVQNVALRVKELDGKAENVVIAYMHDSMEDTEIKYEEICTLFGAEVADGVKSLTKIKDSEYSFEKYLLGIINDENPSILTIKIIDRIDNIKSLKKSPKANKIKKYLNETENVFIPLIEARPLSDLNKELIEELKNELMKYE